MTKIFITTLILLLFSCRNKNAEKEYSHFDKADINQIIEAIIFQDSLNILKADSLMPIPLSKHLRKLRITVPDTISNVPTPIDHNSVSIFNLFNSLINHQRFFARTDSSFFIFQNSYIDSFEIDKEIVKKVFTTTEYEASQRGDTLINTSFYDLTIPILSADQRKAYVELTTNCSGCGEAIALYLQKTKDKWSIVDWQQLWRN